MQSNTKENTCTPIDEPLEHGQKFAYLIKVSSIHFPQRHHFSSPRYSVPGSIFSQATHNRSIGDRRTPASESQAATKVIILKVLDVLSQLDKYSINCENKSRYLTGRMTDLSLVFEKKSQVDITNVGNSALPTISIALY